MFAEPIFQSSPHIYLSALAFTPTSSIIYLNYHPLYSGVAALQNCVALDWQDIFPQPHGFHAAIECAKLSTDGTMVALGLDDRKLQLWDTKAGAAIGKSLGSCYSWVKCLAFSPDGALLASGLDDYTIQIWNTQTGAETGTHLLDQHGKIVSVAFSPDSKLLASGSRDGTVCL